jgi:hypothetical protein
LLCALLLRFALFGCSFLGFALLFRALLLRFALFGCSFLGFALLFRALLLRFALLLCLLLSLSALLCSFLLCLAQFFSLFLWRLGLSGERAGKRRQKRHRDQDCHELGKRSGVMYQARISCVPCQAHQDAPTVLNWYYRAPSVLAHLPNGSFVYWVNAFAITTASTGLRKVAFRALRPQIRFALSGATFANRSYL